MMESYRTLFSALAFALIPFLVFTYLISYLISMKLITGIRTRYPDLWQALQKPGYSTHFDIGQAYFTITGWALRSAYNQTTDPQLIRYGRFLRILTVLHCGILLFVAVVFLVGLFVTHAA
jgi:hypothetical protein